MLTPSYRRTELVLCLVLLAAAPAAADRKSDLYDQAVKAGGAGNLEEAARLFCEAAAMDAKFKDATQMCKLMTQEAERERKKSSDRFDEGLKAFNAGDFDEAEQKFKNVRVGPRVQEARDYLRRIPAARSERAGAEAEKNTFDQAVQAYQRNDFGAAKGLFERISGGRKGDAQNYLSNIRRYEDAMAAGDREAGPNPQQALAKYNEAAGIKSDGPGDPRGKASRMQNLIAAAAAKPAPPEPVSVATTTPSQPPPQPSRTEVAGAVKAPTAKVDVGKLLREAEAAKRAGQMGVASGKYLAVLAVEAGNAEARKGLADISAQGGRQTAGSEADVMLAKAIREFYTGLYEQSEVHIRDYLDAQGSKIGLSHFFLGASLLSRYYLGGERPDDRRLLDEAKNAFKRAKSAPGFQAPAEKYVSPKILKVYQEVTG
jgi:tetratricopeptide (TPR) repeat protein